MNSILKTHKKQYRMFWKNWNKPCRYILHWYLLKKILNKRCMCGKPQKENDTTQWKFRSSNFSTATLSFYKLHFLHFSFKFGMHILHRFTSLFLILFRVFQFFCSCRIGATGFWKFDHPSNLQKIYKKKQACEHNITLIRGELHQGNPGHALGCRIFFHLYISTNRSPLLGLWFSLFETSIQYWPRFES
jgi:hypothetical protein